ncbi:hypothetical protein HY745_13185 [Candidatus Desantisbacteria bacterium]|nr:hypothetical protein [Candidatus Desantisbacteria bacterium]
MKQRYRIFRLSNIILIAIILFPIIIFAADNVFYRGVRPMAMGGAFTAVGDDYNSRNWNPASLATQNSWDLTIELVPKITKDVGDELMNFAQGKGLIQDTIDVMDEFQKTTNSGGINMTDPVTQKMLTQVDKISSKIIEGGNEFYAGFSIRPWKIAFGVSQSSTLRTYIVKSAMNQSLFFPQAFSWIDNKVIYTASVDVVPTISKAFTIKEIIPVPKFLSEGDMTDRDLNWGVNLKYLLRAKYSDEKDPLAFTDLGNEAALKQKSGIPKDMNDLPIGKGIGADIGTIIKLNDYLNMGLNVQDIGVTKIEYDKDKTYTTIDEEFPTNLRIGAAFKPLKFMGYKNTKAMDMTLAADLDNLNGSARDNTDFADKTHLGFETKFSLWRDFLGLGLRVGENQGFPTYGVTLNGLWFFSLQASMYGTDFADYYTLSGGLVF